MEIRNSIRALFSSYWLRIPPRNQIARNAINSILMLFQSFHFCLGAERRFQIPTAVNGHPSFTATSKKH